MAKSNINFWEKEKFDYLGDDCVLYMQPESFRNNGDLDLYHEFISISQNPNGQDLSCDFTNGKEL